MKFNGKGRIRAVGGGRNTVCENDPDIEREILGLVEGNTLGVPTKTLCWTTKSTRNIAKELAEKGKSIGHMTVYRILTKNGYSMQSNKKYIESGNPGPNRDKQFKFINDESTRFISNNDPVISVDAKKKEIIGNFKNNGQEFRPKGKPRKVLDHDFATARATPYGIYDMNANDGLVTVGLSADTAEFAVNSIQTWWEKIGKTRYPDSKNLMITADCGGSNGRRNRLWKVKLQQFADNNGITVHVRHFPPGTSKWNKIEHRMFSFISMNWKGIPLESLEVIVNLIGSTTTRKGLKVDCVEDLKQYKKGIKIDDDMFSGLNILFSENEPEWNYTISPKIKI